jgi:hypothetical protein
LVAAVGCSSHQDSTTGKVGYDSPYGGEIHVERIGSHAGVFDPLTHVDAYFIRDQTPAIARMPAPGTCFDSVTDGLWPVAQAAQRDYIDVGTVTLRGGPQEIRLSKTEPGVDLLGRTHDIVYLHINPDADSFVVADTEYSVDLGGSADYPAQTIGPIYVAKAVTPVNPGPDVKAILIPSGQTFTTSLAPADGVPDGVTMQNFMIVQPPQGGASLVCLGRDAQDGSFTLSAQQIAAMPPAGNILRGHMSLEVIEFNNGKGTRGRRLDLVGVNCLATPYQVH